MRIPLQHCPPRLGRAAFKARCLVLYWQKLHVLGFSSPSQEQSLEGVSCPGLEP